MIDKGKIGTINKLNNSCICILSYGLVRYNKRIVICLNINLNYKIYDLIIVNYKEGFRWGMQ